MPEPSATTGTELEPALLTDIQARVLARLRGALRHGGLLWLGESEWPVGEAAEGLYVVDRRARLFACGPGEGAGA